MRGVLRSALSSRLEVLECRPEIESASPPVLFVHGAYAGAWTWAEHFLAYFAARGFASYAMSFRGHGESQGRDALAWHSLRDYVDDLEETIDGLEEPPVLVGHSMGAMVAMKYLERASAPAAAFLAPVPPQGLFSASLSLALSRPGLFAELNGLLAHGRASPEAMHRALFAGPVPAERLARYYARFQRESPRAIWDMTFFDLPHAWRVQRVPMLALLAERDALFPLEQSLAGFAAFRIPAEVLPEAGHAVMLEPGWQRAADRVLDWLAERLA
jgi:pimeloyl-ACP methyl ester carboxylesterase